MNQVIYIFIHLQCCKLIYMDNRFNKSVNELKFIVKDLELQLVNE